MEQAVKDTFNQASARANAAYQLGRRRFTVDPITRLEGHGKAAATLLGHPYSLHGQVVPGDRRGRDLGYPTANIDYPRDKILPLNGIYACWAWIDDERHRAAVNVGVRPQFHPDALTPLVEAYILDLDRHLYGTDLRLDFVQRLRDEMRFPSVSALIEQIQRDVTSTREILTAATAA